MPDGAFTIEDAIVAPKYSQDAVALEFSHAQDGSLLFVSTWGYWLCWDGCRWSKDDTMRVYDLARAQCRLAAATLPDDKKYLGRDLASAKTVAAVERLARADSRHARRADDFDSSPWELNTPAGVVDLRTGSMRLHSKSDLFTKCTTVAPGGDCPLWKQFLAEITRGDDELVGYLQRMVGYTLTGSIREHVFSFMWGPGGNGKGVFLDTIAAMLGNYATTAMSDVFTMGRNDQHPTHLASLRGARMVCVTETEEGRPWAESRLKSLTGGDKNSARVMRGDPFEFAPIFKLWIAGNHRPVLRNPDPAMRRRLHLIPLTFVPPKPDRQLKDSLTAELAGILQWALEGCAAWQRDGLSPPDVVVDASAEYFAEQDSIASWIAERCFPSTGTLPSGRAYTDWKAWALARGEDPGTEKRFSANMERYFAKKRTNTGRIFLNVSLLPTEPHPERTR
jgi:putative DNA primase/helicase